MVHRWALGLAVLVDALSERDALGARGRTGLDIRFHRRGLFPAAIRGRLGGDSVGTRYAGNVNWNTAP
jgi:hypothetical protein